MGQLHIQIIFGIIEKQHSTNSVKQPGETLPTIHIFSICSIIESCENFYHQWSSTIPEVIGLYCVGCCTVTPIGEIAWLKCTHKKAAASLYLYSGEWDSIAWYIHNGWESFNCMV